jgi:hypothetical protein
MMPDEPINFDFTPEPADGQADASAAASAHHGGGSAGGAGEGSAAGPPGVPASANAAGGALDLPPIPGSPAAPTATPRAAAGAGGTATVPDFRAASHPFAMQSRFQAQGMPAAPHVGRRQKLLYGILCALLAVMFVVVVVLALRTADHAMRTG